MKEITALLVLLFLPVAVSAMYGGDTISYEIADCRNLMVNITDSEMGEWTAYPNCTEQSAGNFYCSCSGNWTLNLRPAVNSKGDFAISIINFDQIEATIQTVFVSTGGTASGMGVINPTTTSTTTTTVPQPTGGSIVTTNQTAESANPQPVLPPASPASAITGFFTIPTVQYSLFGLLGVSILVILARFFFKRRHTVVKNEGNQNSNADSQSASPAPQNLNQSPPQDLDQKAQSSEPD